MTEFSDWVQDKTCWLPSKVYQTWDDTSIFFIKSLWICGVVLEICVWRKSDLRNLEGNPIWQEVSFGRLSSCSLFISQLIASVGRGRGALGSFPSAYKTSICITSICFSLGFSLKNRSLRSQCFCDIRKKIIQAWHVEFTNLGRFQAPCTSV